MGPRKLTKKEEREEELFEKGRKLGFKEGVKYEQDRIKDILFKEDN